KVSNIVVVANDHGCVAATVRKCVKDRIGANVIGRHHFAEVDVIEEIQKLMVESETIDVPIGERVLEVPAKVLQIARTVEIVHHDKPTTIDILAQIRNFGIGEIHLARFGNISERIFKNVVAAEFHDPI